MSGGGLLGTLAQIKNQISPQQQSDYQTWVPAQLHQTNTVPNPFGMQTISNLLMGYPAPLAPNEYDSSEWDKRPDGTPKGTGYFGVLRRPDGGVSTEISVGVGLNGKDTDIPLLVPGLTPDEVNWLLKTPVDQVASTVPRTILNKAIEHARTRQQAGKSVFAN